MAVLVTGGAGFIGSYVLRKLTEKGERVVSLDTQPNSYHIDRLEPQTRNKIVLIEGSVASFREVVAAIEENEVDRVIHLAYVRNQATEVVPYEASWVNAVGTANIFEAARLLGLKRVVYASSIACYGPQSFYGEQPITEDDPLSPRRAYGAMKLANELVAQRYRELYGLSIVGLRIAAVFGHRASGSLTWANDFPSKAAVGEAASTDFRPDCKAALIYVEDVAELLARLCLAERLNHAIYLSGGDVCDAATMAEVVKGYLPDARFTFTGDRGFPYVYLLDDQHIRAELGYSRPLLRDRVRDHINSACQEVG